MALKDVKTNATGAAHKGRHVTRAEAKAAAKKIRRQADRKAVAS